MRWHTLSQRWTPSAASLALLLIVGLPGSGGAQLPAMPASGAPGEPLFEASCARCHTAAGNDRTPGLVLLHTLSPRAVVMALETGVMQEQGEDLTPEQRILIAEYLTGREYERNSLPASAFCSSTGLSGLDLEAVSWSGYGGNLHGTGFQTPERAGLSADDVPDLELAWAFAFPEASQARTKPTVIGDVALVASAFGEIMALETETGCVRWSYQADAGVRGGIAVGEGPTGAPTAYFVDFRTTAYAIDLHSGAEVWRTRVGAHPSSSNTGTPALHDGKLIVPISSMEVSTATDPAYECCTASGAVAAVDAATGELLWYHRVIPDDPVEAGTNSMGTQLWAPSGAPVWASPTVDPARGLVYVGTGENYTRPTGATSDAILAIDLETGELEWAFQGFGQDAWSLACDQPGHPNCPTPPGPDLDFGMAPILVERADGKEILVAGQKSGVVWALDPDADGAVLWQTQIGKGSALGGIHWGMATDGRYVYAANSDRPDVIVVDVHPDIPSAPGLYALDLMNGEVVWDVPAPTDTCGDRPLCHASNSAAPTVIPGVVFAGGIDGHIRAHSAEDGRIIWDFDTTTINSSWTGVAAQSGSIDGPGPVVADGMLFVNSGYGMFNQMPGNLLLAFRVSDQ